MQVFLGLSLEADLRSVFSWNTKQLYVFMQAEYVSKDNRINQVVVWDKIVEAQADANLHIPNLRQKYAFADKGRNLRDKDINLTVAWNVMPRVGALYTDSRTFKVGRLPKEYSY